MDTFMENIQVPAFGPGGGIDHNGVGRNLAGNREREVFLPGLFFILDKHCSFPEEKDAAGAVLAVETHFPDLQAQLFRQHPGGTVLRILYARQEVFPQALRPGLDLVLPEDRYQEAVQLPEAAVRLVRRQVQFLHLTAETLFRAEPEPQAETETAGNVPPFLFNGHGN